MRTLLGSAVVGLMLGFGLSRIGFASWTEVHRMFTFGSFRMLLTFGTACVLLLGFWRLLAKRGVHFAPRPIHPGTVVGSLLFGAGWALAGACPAIALVQLGEGNVSAIATLAGILVGNALYPLVHRRAFRWSAASCSDN
jgi:uncharacterized protein